jgi:hypothetical protein
MGWTLLVSVELAVSDAVAAFTANGVEVSVLAAVSATAPLLVANPPEVSTAVAVSEAVPFCAVKDGATYTDRHSADLICSGDAAVSRSSMPEPVGSASDARYGWRSNESRM